jgi:hypothetical protein
MTKVGAIILSKREQNYFLFSLLLSGLSFRFLGNVYLTEVFLTFFALRSILIGRKAFFQGHFRFLPLIFLLWFIANLFSSVINGKAFSLTLISIATVAITGFTFRAIHEFFTLHPEKILQSVIIFALGRLIGIFLNPLPYTSQLPWKFGYGEWAILLALATATINRSMKMYAVFIPGLIMISITNQARTLALLTAGSAVASFFTSNKRTSVFSLIAIIFLPIFIYYGYLHIALAGQLGTKEINRAKLLVESDLGPLAARIEFIFSTRAFAASPIVGYGFEPEVKREIIADGYQVLVSNGVKVDYSYLEKLPMHSFIMSALVQGGVFAGIFWIFALFNSFKVFIYMRDIPIHEKPLVAYLSLALIDRILFSPFGAYERLNAALFLGYLLTLQPKKLKNDN